MDQVPAEQIIAIPGAGDCFFQAAAAGLDLIQNNPGSYVLHAQLRTQIAEELRINSQRYDLEDIKNS
jgi:hypothetical protein